MNTDDELREAAEKAADESYHLMMAEAIDAAEAYGIDRDEYAKHISDGPDDEAQLIVSYAIDLAKHFAPLLQKRDTEIQSLKTALELTGNAMNILKIRETEQQLAAARANREEFAEGRDHLTVSGTFQSDKYSWCAAGFVPLKLTDPAARDLLAEYAKRRETIDKEFPRDLNEALENVPVKPNPNYKPFEIID